MFCGEIQKVEVTLKNIGNAPLTNIYVTSVNAKLFSLGNEDKLDGKFFFFFFFYTWVYVCVCNLFKILINEIIYIYIISRTFIEEKQ